MCSASSSLDDVSTSPRRFPAMSASIDNGKCVRAAKGGRGGKPERSNADHRRRWNRVSPWSCSPRNSAAERWAGDSLLKPQFRRRCVSSADHQFQGQMPRQIHSRHGEPKPRKNGITRSSLEQVNEKSVLQPTRIQIYTQFSQGKFNQTHPRWRGKITLVKGRIKYMPHNNHE